MRKIKFFILVLLMLFSIFSQSKSDGSKDLLDVPIITILPLEDNYCAGSNMMIVFEVSSNFEQDNIFIAELSDEFGNFDNPVEIGVLNSNTSGVISAHLPKSLVEGNSYRVRIKASNPQTISNDNGKNIYIYELPDVTINGEFEPCKQKVYTYNTSENFNNSYLWSVTGGYFITDSTQSSVEIQWGTAVDLGFLTLIKTNIVNGCSDTNVVQISLKSAPLTQIISGTSRACLAGIYTYRAGSSTVVPSVWNVFGGSLLSNSDNSTAYVLWSQLGKGWVELTKTNEYGCIGRDTFFVDVFPVPYASFNGLQTVVENSTTVYNANYEDNLIYNWEVSGGEIIKDFGDSIRVKWGVKGTGKITLIESYIESGCSDTVERSITILEGLPDFEISGKQNVCLYSLENYEIPLTYHVIIKWTVENGKIIGPDNDYSVTVNWQNVGEGIVRCRLISTESGDTSESEMKINIRGLPEIIIDGSLKFCLNHGPYQLNFAKPEGGNYKGNGIEENIFYPDRVGLGKQTVTYDYTDGNGCSNSETVQIEVFPNPPKPELNIDSEGFYTNYKSGNIWYVSGQVIEGDNDDRLDMSQLLHSSDVVWVVHVDSNGCESPASDAIEVGVEDFDEDLKIYPNPSEDYIIIYFKNSKNSSLIATIYDVYGNILRKINFKSKIFENKFIIDIKDFANGMYFIKLERGESLRIEKLIIKK